MQIWPEVEFGGRDLGAWASARAEWGSARTLTGRMRSRSAQTTSEHVLGSGVMTSNGSPSMRHSQMLHRLGRNLAKTASGGETG